MRRRDPCGRENILQKRAWFCSWSEPLRQDVCSSIVFENIPQAQTTKMVKQPTKTAKSNDRIEELTKLKDLLDTGVISQEEFDAKKKQIFGVWLWREKSGLKKLSPEFKIHKTKKNERNSEITKMDIHSIGIWREQENCLIR